MSYGYDPDFDETTGRSGPDLRAAETALQEAQTGSTRTNAIIEESRRLVAGLVAVRVENHFAEKIRQIIHGHKETPV